MNYGHGRVPIEIVEIERQYRANPMHRHSGNYSGIVHLNSGDAIPEDEVSPRWENVRGHLNPQAELKRSKTR